MPINLYPQVWSFENLYLAYRKARKGKRGRAPAATFEFNLESNLLQLQEELETKTYRPGPYTSFYIHEPKRRLISAAPFRDRVAHHALCNVIEPLFERRFISDSYANRQGKGTHRTLDRCQEFARHHRYVLQCDIRQFFPSIDHTVLREALARVITDPDVMWLVDRILASGVGVLSEEYEMVWFPGDDLLAVHRPRGLPIGNLTSQFWANVCLNPFDHFVKRELRCKAYLRYVNRNNNQGFRVVVSHDLPGQAGNAVRSRADGRGHEGEPARLAPGRGSKSDPGRIHNLGRLLGAPP
jgi:retron-type reverse transcriptase